MAVLRAHVIEMSARGQGALRQIAQARFETLNIGQI